MPLQAATCKPSVAIIPCIVPLAFADARAKPSAAPMQRQDDQIKSFRAPLPWLTKLRSSLPVKHARSIDVPVRVRAGTAQAVSD